jgi:hypothetical protein
MKTLPCCTLICDEYVSPPTSEGDAIHCSVPSLAKKQASAFDVDAYTYFSTYASDVTADAPENCCSHARMFGNDFVGSTMRT